MPGSHALPANHPRNRLLPDFPEKVASLCHGLDLPGLVWLDSAVAGPGARSLVAACPESIMAGPKEDWPNFEQELGRFQGRNPEGAAVGWVEYDGAFKFGFFTQPLFFHHDTHSWTFPGGRPSWADHCGKEEILKAPKLHFAFEMTPAQFCARVEIAQRHIAAGDIYQVNLSHRASAKWLGDGVPFALYLALRTNSPAPQAAYLALDRDRTVLCSSPEEFATFQGRMVRTRPIKGTRPRGDSATADQAAASELLASEKERAELLMITDLLRNDLGQFCEYGSIEVRELFRVERFAQVFHLVSTIEGRLREGVNHSGALQLCLPGGSITGAPKRRAREIIGRLETEPRGLYTGTIGVFSGTGESCFNIAIRTLIIEKGTAHFRVGAGIVADSDPQREWEETLHKAEGILKACSGLR